LHLILQLLGEFLEALAGNHREPIDQRVKAPFAILTHRQTQAATDGLPRSRSVLISRSVQI